MDTNDGLVISSSASGRTFSGTMVNVAMRRPSRDQEAGPSRNLQILRLYHPRVEAAAGGCNYARSRAGRLSR